MTLRKEKFRKYLPIFKNAAQMDRLKRIHLGLSVRALKVRVPWGYKINELDKEWLVPDLFALRLLYKAKDYLLTCTMKEVSVWLQFETGYHTNAQTLQYLLYARFPFKEIFLTDNEREQFYRCPTDFTTCSEQEQVEEEGNNITGTEDAETAGKNNCRAVH